MFNIGDKVRIKNPIYGDNEVHTILNVQKTHGDILYFLHYYSWMEEDELILIENKIDMEVGDKVKYKNQEEDGFDIMTIKSITTNKFNSIEIHYEEGSFDYIEDLELAIIDKEDIVTSPIHYNTTTISALNVIDDWSLDFRLGNVIKYIKRHKLKGTALQDLKKAAEYLKMSIELLEKDGEVK